MLYINTLSKHEEDQIVDAPLDSEHMSNMNGNSTPYFENLTSALLFCWIQKHNICKIQIYLIILFKHINILYNDLQKHSNKRI